MITRNRARKALAEVQQQQLPAQIQSAAFVKLQQSPERVLKKKFTSAGSEELSAEGVATIAKKMNVISLESEEDDSPNSKRSAIELSESSQSVIDLSSSDGADDHSSDTSEDEDGAESNYSEDENHIQRKSTFSTPARHLVANDVAKVIRGTITHDQRRSLLKPVPLGIQGECCVTVPSFSEASAAFAHLLGGDLKKLKADDCKAYLRNYEMLVTGTKPVLIDRIKQHLQMMDGGSSSYDRSTFTMDCTGDVCKGDVVVFNQKVYKKYSSIAKSTKQAGSRTVAGRVVKESYGAQRQQHTFTVEVLWSTGCRPLPPMKPLLVKGRNLYKRKTFRQEWADEGERRRTLGEKHDRGAAARQIRAMKLGRFKGRQGNAGRFGSEGSSTKQLANPYTDTLASKENSHCSSGTVFQAPVPGHQFAAVGTHNHVVHHSTGTGANSVPLGRVRQFGLPSENRDMKEASGDATTSVNKHRQWFKPAPLLLPSDSDARKQQPCEAQNVTRSPQLQGGRRGSQSGPRNVRQSVSIQAPIAVSVSKGAGSTSGTTQCQNGKNESLLNRPSSPLMGRPASPFRSRPSSPSLGRPMSPLLNRDYDLGAPSFARTVSPFPNRPSNSSLGRTVSPFPNRPSSPVLNRTVSPFPGRPSNSSLCSVSLPNKPSSPVLNRTVSPFPNRPSNSSLGRTVSPFPNRRSSPVFNRTVPPFPHRPSNSSLGRIVSPFPNRPSSPVSNRTVSPLPNRTFNSVLNRAMSPCPNRPSNSLLGKPVPRFPNKPSVRNGSLTSAPSSPSPDRSGSPSHHRPPSPMLTHSQTGFPCPTNLCTNRGSISCSNGVCYHCCKRKGGVCRNPRHRPQL